MHWFKHDSDANSDSKLQNVLLDYGLEGYGLYWYCIELIAGKVSKDNLTFQLEHDVRILARNTGSTQQKVTEMMKYFIEIGLFECSNNTITCMKLAKRLDQSMTSNPEMRSLISKLKNHDGVMTPSIDHHDGVMQEEIRLDKKEESKDISTTPSKLNVPLQEVLNAYHEILPMVAAVQIFSDKRKSLVRSFWKKRSAEYLKSGNEYTIDHVKGYLQYIAENCQWMLYDRPNGKGGFWKAKNFDYFFKDDCYISVKEQRFDNRD
jgi:hypothetical protein